jgi:DNA mismatch repair protein MutL
LIEDGRVLFQSPVCTTLAERVGEIFGRQLVADLLPVAMAETGLKLSGLIGKPGVNRSTRHELLMFVNRRPVDSRTLNYALIESYATALAKGRYPVAVLFLELDPAAVDVNVHPAKREVRFRSEGAVRGFVIRAVLQRLREWGAPAPRVEPASAGQVHPAASEVMPGDPVSLAAPATVNLPPTAFVIKPPAPPAIVRTAVAPLAVSAPSASAALLGWRFLGTAHSDYALWETPSGLMVLDRRAAHERVWFERLEMQFKQGAVASQRLLFAIPVEFDAIASALLTDQLAFLQRHGFAVAEFGRNFFRIEAVPVWLESSDAVIFLRDIIGLMRDGQLDGKNLDLARTALAQLAAQQAVRLPSSHNETEALALVSQLFACTQPHTSPAGRPTHFELSRGELLRRFQR